MTFRPKALWSASANLAGLIFFPSFCRLCSSLCERPGEKIVCDACFGEILPERSSFCICCGRFFSVTSEPHLCGECLESRPPFAFHRSCAGYRGRMKDLILLFKYRGYRVLGKRLAEFMLAVHGETETLWSGVDLIVPVPLHRRRKRRRGFNQSAVLAAVLAQAKGLPLLRKAIVKVKDTPPQTTLEAQERRASVRGVYRPGNKKALRGKTVLLVDDVYTTGATLRECGTVLIEAGAGEVRALTAAQA